MLPKLDDLERWLAAQEAAVGGVRSGCEKRIVWHDGANSHGRQKTKTALVYIHGFSATGEEIRPLPDLVAKALGANLYFARLTGHGQDGAAMGRATLRDWECDVVEALSIGRRIGEEVILMGCSTGCTLITQALAEAAGRPESQATTPSAQTAAAVKAAVFVSPNFGLTNAFAHTVLQLPGVRHWGPRLLGRERSFDPINADHSAYWTVKYDTAAVFTMADAVRAAMGADIENISVPAYFAFNEEDQVVRADFTRKVMARWGGDVRMDLLVQTEADDAMGHVMAGDVFSPGQTEPLAERITAWAASL